MNITKEQFIRNIKRIAKHRKEAQFIINKHKYGKLRPIQIEEIEVEVPELPKKFNGTP
jgi:hypothetical protein